MQVVTAGLLILFLFGMNLAYAETYQFTFGAPGDSFWHFARSMEKIHESITLDPVAKKELVTKHAMERQAEIETCRTCTTQAIEVIQKIRDEKLVTAEGIKFDGTSPLDMVLSKIRQASEMDDIQLAYADFRSGKYDREELENRVNRLESVQKNCNERIIISELESDRMRAYEKLQQTCPILKSMSAEQAAFRLNS